MVSSWIQVIKPQGQWYGETIRVAENGLGFGWKDINVYRLAVDYRYKETVDSGLTAFGIPGKIDMYQNSVDIGYAMKF